MNMINKKDKITIVGAGVTGLTIAYFLNQEGYKNIKVIDQLSSPLKNNFEGENVDSISWNSANGRTISIDETKPHNKNKILFLKNELSKSEKFFLNKMQEIVNDEELSNKNTKKLINLNTKGLALWSFLIKAEPNLFKNLLPNNGKICRVYSYLNSQAIDYQIKIHENDLFKLNQDDIKTRFKCLNYNNLKMGVEVDGFSLHIHDFYKRMILKLEENGVEFQWSKKINKRLNLNEKEFAIYATQNIDYLQDDYLDNNVKFFHGCMLKVPNIKVNGRTLKESLKIHDENAVLNVLASKTYPDYFYVNGGFGFAGDTKPKDVDFTDFEKSIVEIGKKFFPKQFEKGYELIKCTRPVTPDGLPIIKQFSHNEFFVGAANGGGLVQAPILAQSLIEYIKSSKIESNINFMPIMKNKMIYTDQINYENNQIRSRL